MPDESVRSALNAIKKYLDAGHSLDAIREVGWAEWIDRLEAEGYDLRTGRLAISPPEDEPPAIQSAITSEPTADITQPEEPPPNAPRRRAPPHKSGRSWYRSGWAIAIGVVVGILVIGGIVGGIVQWNTNRENQELLAEILERADEAYEEQAAEQAQIDTIFGVCSAPWVEETAQNTAQTTDSIISLTDASAAASELSEHLKALCGDGDTATYCERVAKSFGAYAEDFGADQEFIDGIEEGCLQEVSTTNFTTAVRLSVGECVLFADVQAGVGAIDCSATHDTTVAAVFEVEGGEYPGLDAVEQMAEERCTQVSPFANMLYPTLATWNIQADRQIACLMPVDYDLRTGDCLIYGQSLQRTGCSIAHDAQVAAVLTMAGSRYPGNAAVQSYADENCPFLTDQVLFPSQETWELGDRQIACLDE